MDPTACLLSALADFEAFTTLIKPDSDSDSRYFALDSAAQDLEDLCQWLDRGGFAPVLNPRLSQRLDAIIDSEHAEISGLAATVHAYCKY